MIQIGQVINGKFRIQRLLSRGGMSTVYLAEDTRLAMHWVVKVIPKSVYGRDNSLQIQYALSEASIMKDLSHPAIVRIVDIAEDGEALYIIEDYVSGISLQEYLNRHAVVTQAQLKDWAEQVCGILMYLHSREPAIIYRDIKPDNLILTDTGFLKLIDFGIARRYSSEKSRDTEYLGTERYAAPEQYEENGLQTDARTDIYCLGMTLKSLAAGCTDLSAGMQEIINRCIREDPAERYASAQQMLEDLQRAGKKEKKAARTRPGKPHAVMQKKRQQDVKPDTGVKPTWLWLLFLAALCLGVAVYKTAFSAGNVPLSMNSAAASPADCNRILEMTDTFLEDRSFGKEEEEALLQNLLPHLSEFQKQKDFDMLAYRIGILYWYGYDYGADHMAGMIASQEWFHMAGGQKNSMSAEGDREDIRPGYPEPDPGDRFAEDTGSPERDVHANMQAMAAEYALIGSFLEQQRVKEQEFLVQEIENGQQDVYSDRAALDDPALESSAGQNIAHGLYRRCFDCLYDLAARIKNEQTTLEDVQQAQAQKAAVMLWQRQEFYAFSGRLLASYRESFLADGVSVQEYLTLMQLVSARDSSEQKEEIHEHDEIPEFKN